MNDYFLSDTQTFIAEFTKALSRYKTHEEAYDHVEERYKSIYHRNKFASFESFKNTMYYHLNKTKK